MAQLAKLSKQYLRMLLYGLPGSTKTRTALSGCGDPRLGPVMVLNAGGNPESATSFLTEWDVVIDMEQLEDFNDPYDYIFSGQPKKGKFVEQFGLTNPDRPLFGTVVVDTLTHVQRMMFDKVMSTRALPGIIVIKREWEHYNKILYSMINFARTYFSLPCHVIMTAQEREAGADNGRPIGPMLEGDSQVEVPSYALIVARMMHVTRAEPRLRKVVEGEGAQAIAILKQGVNYQAKDQHSDARLGDYMLDPTLPKMLDAIYPPPPPPDDKE